LRRQHDASRLFVQGILQRSCFERFRLTDAAFCGAMLHGVLTGPNFGVELELSGKVSLSINGTELDDQLRLRAGRTASTNPATLTSGKRAVFIAPLPGKAANPREAGRVNYESRLGRRPALFFRGALILNPAVETRPSLQAVGEAANPTAPQFIFSVTSADFVTTCNQSDTLGFEGFNCRI
jgi:hypothetical protein